MLFVIFEIYLLSSAAAVKTGESNWFLSDTGINTAQHNIRHGKSKFHIGRTSSTFREAKYDSIRYNEQLSILKPPNNLTLQNDNIFTSNTQKMLQSTVNDSDVGYKHLQNLFNIKYSKDATTSELFDDGITDEELDNSTTRNVFQRNPQVDVVTHFLQIVESQHLLGANCTAGTDLNLGDGVVDRYAQERFRVEADVAVNRANMLTRIWKYADPSVTDSEYLLHALVFAMVEFDDDIFAGGNCYDEYQYKDYWLFCPYAYRLPEGPILVKDLAVEYKYLSNTSEWFYIARKNAERVIGNYNQFSKGKFSQQKVYSLVSKIFIIFL